MLRRHLQSQAIIWYTENLVLLNPKSQTTIRYVSTPNSKLPGFEIFQATRGGGHRKPFGTPVSHKDMPRHLRKRAAPGIEFYEATLVIKGAGPPSP